MVARTAATAATSVLERDELQGDAARFNQVLAFTLDTAAGAGDDPASGGRSTTEPDPTEWIWIRARGRDGFAGSP